MSEFIRTASFSAFCGSSSSFLHKGSEQNVRMQNDGYINLKYTPPHHKCVIGEFVPVEKMLQEVGALIAGVAPRHS